MGVRCLNPRYPRYLQVTGANCKPGSEGLVHASTVEIPIFACICLQYLQTIFNRRLFSITFSFLFSNFVSFDYFLIFLFCRPIVFIKFQTVKL